MNELTQMLMLFGAAIITPPLLAADTKGAAWAFLLGAELAIGLTAFLLIMMRAF